MAKKPTKKASEIWDKPSPAVVEALKKSTKSTKSNKNVDIHNRSNSRNSNNSNSSTDVPRKQEVLVKELTPELADKLWKSVQKGLYDKRVSKEAVLHHLKQLKAQMGRAIKAEYGMNTSHTEGIKRCMVMIDNKIQKIK